MTNTRFIGKPLETKDSLTPVKGFKTASLLLHVPTKTVSVLPIHRTASSFEFSASSLCEKENRKRHNFMKCHCGFYAYKTLHEAYNHQQEFGSSARNELLFEVALSGKVVIAEHGYRAQRQRVTGITVPNNCVECEAPSTALSPNYPLTVFDVQNFALLRPSCLTCSSKYSTQITYEELAIKASYKDYQPVQIHQSESWGLFPTPPTRKQL